MQRLLPEDSIKEWPEVFGEVIVIHLPLQYLYSIRINFNDGKTWDIKLTKHTRNTGWRTFEKNLSEYCKKRGYDGVICGHIHHAEIKEINGVTYMNDGDWVESMTALVEHHDGLWEIVTWTQENDNVVDDIDSGTRKQSAGYSRKSYSTVSNAATV